MHLKIVVDAKAGLEEVSQITQQLEVLGHNFTVRDLHPSIGSWIAVPY